MLSNILAQYTKLCLKCFYLFLNIYKIAGANNIYGAAHIYYVVRLMDQLYTKEIICDVVGIDSSIYKIIIVTKTYIILEGTKKKYYHQKHFI